MLSQVTTVGSFGSGYHFYWSDDFSREGTTLGGGWSAASWGAKLQPPTKAVLAGPYLERGSSDAVRELMDFSTSSAYAVEMLIVPTGGSHWGTYIIYARLDNTTPDITQDGIRAAITLDGAAGNYDGTLTSYTGGVATSYAFAGGVTGSSKQGWFRVDVNANTVTVSWMGTQLVSQAVSANSGRRVGFGMQTKAVYPPAMCLVDAFRVYGSPVGDTGELRRRTYLVASAGGNLYADRTLGQMAQVTGDAADFSTTHFIQAAPRHQMLYVADWDAPKAVSTTGDLDAAGTTLSDANVADFTALSIDADNDLVVISNGAGLTTDGVYRIASVAAAGVLLTTAASTGVGTCFYRIERGPKIYDPARNIVTMWSADAGGDIPVGCKVICTYRDRLMLGGSDFDPHEWHAAKQGNPGDFNYNPTDPNDRQAAVLGSASEAGAIGDVLRALIPFRDDFVIFGCQGSMWVLRGDPAWSGQLDAISHEVGILSAKSWCEGPQGEIYFMSYDGLYMLPPSAQGTPKPLSPTKLPRDLQRLDPGSQEVLLEWSDEEQGVHIYVSPE